MVAENRNMIEKFIIYGLLGWSMEIVWTGINSLINGDLRMEGFTSLWMFLVYGLAVFLEPIHNIIRKWVWFFRGIIWVLLIWGIEYATGLFFHNVMGILPWYYTGSFAVDGLVRLDFAPAWFIAGLIFEKTHDRLEKIEA